MNITIVKEAGNTKTTLLIKDIKDEDSELSITELADKYEVSFSAKEVNETGTLTSKAKLKGNSAVLKVKEILGL